MLLRVLFIFTILINVAFANEYWTAERMRNAKPMPLPTVDPTLLAELPPIQSTESASSNGAPPETYIRPQLRQVFIPETFTKTRTINEGTLKFPFTSSRLIPTSADIVYPYSTVGKLFFTIPDVGDFICSAAVLRLRIVLTAGHCVHSGSKTKGYYQNFRFVPAYRNGAMPYKAWDYSFVATTNEWMTSDGKVPNAADYAMLEMKDQVVNNVEKRIGSVTGYLGYKTETLEHNHAHLLGYPCNLDSCEYMHQVTAQSARVVANNNVEYGSDMSHGASGGPWIQNFGALASGQTGGLNPGLNKVIGLTSYGYSRLDSMASGSSTPDKRFLDLLNMMCARQVGNC